MSAPGRRPPWIPIAAAVAVVAIIGIVVVATRSDDPETTTTTSTAGAVAGLDAPAGWSASRDGRTIAEHEADLDADRPTGPRATVQVTDEPVTVDGLTKAIADDNLDKVEPPETLSIDGHTAVSITVTEGTGTAAMTTTYVSVEPTPGDAVLFVLEAPTSTYPAAEATLLDALDIS